MVNFRTLSARAKDLVDKRGGTESLKQDAEQLKTIAEGKGSMSEKAKAAAAALKEPGAARRETPADPGATGPREGKARAGEKVAGEDRGKHAHADKQGAEGGGSGV